MNRFPRLAALLLLVLACVAAALPRREEKPPFPHVPLGVPNGCFVESVYFYDTVLRQQGSAAWVRVLQWGAKENDELTAGHAVALFEHDARLWAYDINHGFLPLALDPTQRERVEQVSPLLLARYPRVEMRHPLYRQDFPQTPDGAPAEELAHHALSAFRDATRVASRLAGARPVNAVEFSYVEEGETRVSAACVFLFHGRLCVYFPDKGTYPFLARQRSVHNLRLLQQCFRRVYPGAFALKNLSAAADAGQEE